MTHQTLTTLKHSIEADNLEGVAKLLAQDAGRLDFLAQDGCASPGQVLAAVRSVGMADLFLRHGLTVAMVSEWWAPGFGLNKISPVVAEHLSERGAVVTPHAAAALGLVGRLRRFLDQRPELVHAKGGDGGRPCTSVEISRPRGCWWSGARNWMQRTTITTRPPPSGASATRRK